MQERLEDNFKNCIRRGNLFHAYLFFGENEGAIFDFGRKLANFLESGQWDAPARFLNDYLIIKREEEETIGIDRVRQLKNFFSQKPILAQKRTAIVYPADSLTEAAQNALLKIVEEPPGGTLLILISRREESLLPTLLSRLHRVYFSCSSGETKGRRNKKQKNLPEEGNRSQSETDKKLEEIFAKFVNEAIDDRDNLIQNADITREVLERLRWIRQFNLNKPLQLKFLNLLIKKSSATK